MCVVFTINFFDIYLVYTWYPTTLEGENNETINRLLLTKQNVRYETTGVLYTAVQDGQTSDYTTLLAALVGLYVRSVGVSIC